jgi:hypothetical protein
MTRGPIWGNRNRTKKSQNLKSSSELTYRMYKLCKLLLLCTFQNHYDENIRVVREENKKSTRKKMPKIRLFCP